MSLSQQLTQVMKDAFAAAGHDEKFGKVVTSKRRDLGQFQCNGALQAAQEHGRNPRKLAQAVIDNLATSDMVQSVTIAGPGFINLVVTDEYLVEFIRNTFTDNRFGCAITQNPRTVVVDYGGANVAKPMHVGHLRSAIIGESLKRLLRFSGDTVVGDIHLGDWGLPMGMIIAELKRRHPDWLYFHGDGSEGYPLDSPVTIQDLEELYPTASRRAQEDTQFMDEARQATAELQSRNPGYHALWRHFVDVSIQELKRDYGDLSVEFDLWLGESDTDDRIVPLVERLTSQGFARASDSALIVDVSSSGQEEMPPLILRKSDGAVLYATTDLATLESRVSELNADLILYVVDKRQSLHFEQVFQAAHRTGIAPDSVELEHIAFGTMNGKDGRPFRTRSGGVLKLRTLIQLLTDRAKIKIQEANYEVGLSETDLDAIAQIVGVAALKFADLVNHRTTDYVFDLDRFLSFEGRTGPYLLYTIARANSILRRWQDGDPAPEMLRSPSREVERELLLKMTELPDVFERSLEEYAVHHICEYVYTLCVHYNQFYHQCHILREQDRDQQLSWLYLTDCFVRMASRLVHWLGMEVPSRM